jgi:hypothetical protein
MRRSRNPSQSYEADDSEQSQIAKAELAVKTAFWLDLGSGAGDGCQTKLPLCLAPSYRPHSNGTAEI